MFYLSSWLHLLRNKLYISIGDDATINQLLLSFFSEVPIFMIDVEAKQNPVSLPYAITGNICFRDDDNGCLFTALDVHTAS